MTATAPSGGTPEPGPNTAGDDDGGTTAGPHGTGRSLERGFTARPRTAPTPADATAGCAASAPGVTRTGHRG